MRRGPSSSWAGIRYGIRASVIFRLARVIRCAIVVSGTRNARAICAVVRPQTTRSVSAICACAGQRRVAAGEDQPQALVGLGLDGPLQLRQLGDGNCVSRRSTSRPRRRATVNSQASGRSGIPSAGQCRSAASTASCTKSSAVAKSPVTWISDAASRPAFSRTTRVNWSCTASVTWTRTRSGEPPPPGSPARSWPLAVPHPGQRPRSRRNRSRPLCPRQKARR